MHRAAYVAMTAILAPEGAAMVTATQSKKKTRAATPNRLEAIRPGDGLIPLRIFLAKTGQKSHAWMTARRRAKEMGITLAYQHGRQIFVSADDWIQFLMSNPAPVSEPRCNDGDSAEVADCGSADGA
jgi:pyruvate/2-oxoglutarate dehydrogenase complex dihydrolipoamide acyltransferase (E2) component